jgi:hypothetical protein
MSRRDLASGELVGACHIRQVIDDYENRLMKSKVRIDYRGYLHQPTFTYAFYKRNKSNVLEIFKFEK